MRILAEFEPQTIEELRHSGEPFWLDLTSPSAETLEAVDAALGLTHDAWAGAGLQERDSPLRGPFLWSRSEAMVISAIIPADPGRDTIERELVLRAGDGWLVSSHPPIESIESLRSGGALRSPGVALGRLLAVVADAMVPMLTALDTGTEEAERLALAADPSALALIQRLRGRALALRHLAIGHRQVAAGLLDEMIDRSRPADEARAARGAYERFARILDALDVDRELLSAATDVHLSATSNRLSQLAERLGVIAAIFLPLTLVVGFFGQNFGWLIEHTQTFPAFLVFGIGSILLSVVIVVALLDWFGYLRAPDR